MVEIKAGQVWVTYDSKEPIMIGKVGNLVFYWWYETDGAVEVSGGSIDRFIRTFYFVSDNISDDDFKNWCMTGKKSEVKSVIKDNLNIDNINHPKHYTSDPSGIECIEITRHRNFNIGNAIKYLWRAGLKEGNSDVQDLQKAIWYIQDEIKRLEQTQCDI